MTEDEWLKSTAPSTILNSNVAPSSERKLRLFACACCRQIWDRLPDESSRSAVECAERFADRLASTDELQISYRLARELSTACRRTNIDDPLQYTLLAAADTCYSSAHSAANTVVADAAWQSPPDEFWGFTRRSEKIAQSELLRDIFANPFRPVSFDSRWRTSDTLGLARGIYEDRAFDRMPILADALMDAGCDDVAILEHCRRPGPHVRGCWVVDLVLGKE
jgi:hypothetical protein